MEGYQVRVKGSMVPEKDPEWIQGQEDRQGTRVVEGKSETDSGRHAESEEEN